MSPAKAIVGASKSTPIADAWIVRGEGINTPLKIAIRHNITRAIATP
jgi:hypothetical protein